MEKINPITKLVDNFSVRHGSSDEKALAEIYDKKVYLKPKLGFTVEPDDIWADLGVNIGSFSIFSSGVAKSVHGFEAEKKNFEIANENKKRNHRENLIIEHAAIMPDSYDKEFVTLYVNEDEKQAWRHTVFKTNWKTKATLVKAVRFSDAIKGANCVKMDIEGAEIPILMEKPSLSHIKKLVFEWSFDRDRKLKTAREAIAHLETQFERVNYPKLPMFSDTWDNFPFCMNVFCWNPR